MDTSEPVLGEGEDDLLLTPKAVQGKGSEIVLPLETQSSWRPKSLARGPRGLTHFHRQDLGLWLQSPGRRLSTPSPRLRDLGRWSRYPSQWSRDLGQWLRGLGWWSRDLGRWLKDPGLCSSNPGLRQWRRLPRGLGFSGLERIVVMFPLVGSPVPRAVLFKTHNITSPQRIALAFTFARSHWKILEAVLAGDAAVLDKLA